MNRIRTQNDASELLAILLKLSGAHPSAGKVLEHVQIDKDGNNEGSNNVLSIVLQNNQILHINAADIKVEEF